MSNGNMSEHEWKREVHRYIDEQIEKHNDANQKEFQQLRDGQLGIVASMDELETSMTGVESRLTGEIQSVRAASDTAHKEIIARLERLEKKLD